jgi:prepilin-type processing-associated H-X9-DG protein
VAPRHNFITYILPYIEQQALANQIDMTKHWDFSTPDPNDNDNNKITNNTPIESVRCPSTPNIETRLKSGCDYAICVNFVHTAGKAKDTLVSRGDITDRGPESGDMDGTWSSILRVRFKNSIHIPVRIKHVTDGMSNSFMIFECAGRPDKFDQLKNQIDGATLAESTNGQATGRNWADHQSFYSVHDLCGGTQMTNCHNDNEIFSFHNGACNFTMGDGAVRFVQENIDPEVFVSLFTRAAGDIVKE